MSFECNATGKNVRRFVRNSVKLKLLQAYESEQEKTAISQVSTPRMTRTRTDQNFFSFVLLSVGPPRHKLLKRFPAKGESPHHSLFIRSDRIVPIDLYLSLLVCSFRLAFQGEAEVSTPTNRNHVSLHWIQTNLRQR